MSPLDFEDGLLTGFPEIDNQHREIFARFRTLSEVTQRGHSRAEIAEFLIWLFDYTVTHFLAEEAIMRDAHYVGLREHKREHFHFWRTCLQLQEDFYTASTEDIGVVTDRIVLSVADWLRVHILTTDRELALYLRSRADGMLD